MSQTCEKCNGRGFYDAGKIGVLICDCVDFLKPPAHPILECKQACCNSAKVLAELMSELNELINLSKTQGETPSYMRTLIFAYENAQANLKGEGKNR